VSLFHSRPFRVLESSRFVDASLERVDDVLSYAERARRFVAVYG